jgi:hypothetical protein
MLILSVHNLLHNHGSLSAPLPPSLAEADPERGALKSSIALLSVNPNARLAASKYQPRHEKNALEKTHSKKRARKNMHEKTRTSFRG